jgi:hypothetical protein
LSAGEGVLGKPQADNCGAVNRLGSTITGQLDLIEGWQKWVKGKRFERSTIDNRVSGSLNRNLRPKRWKRCGAPSAREHAEYNSE